VKEKFCAHGAWRQDSKLFETQFLERRSVRVVDGAAHTQKDDVESNGGSLENVAKVSVLFLYCISVQTTGVVLLAPNFMNHLVISFKHDLHQKSHISGHLLS
jgi:hypothetical protein